MKKIIVLLIISGTLSASAQEAKVQCLFLFSFAKNLQWPAGAVTSKFVIGVFNSPEVAEELSISVASKKVGEFPIAIKIIHSAEELFDCQLVYVGASTKAILHPFLQAVKNKPVVIVTSLQGGTKFGSSLNFVNLDGKIRFEFNSIILHQQTVKMPGNMKSLGIDIIELSHLSNTAD